MNGINVIPQYNHHSDAWIIGTAQDLALLRDAITKALENNFGTVETCASDGECFDLTVEVCSDVEFAKRRPFYTSMMTQDKFGNWI